MTVSWNDILKLPEGALAGERRVPKTQLAEQARLAKAPAASVKLLDKLRDIRFFASLNKSNSRILPVKNDAYDIESVIFLTCGLNSTTGIAEALRMVHGCFPNPTVILAEGFANPGIAVSAALRRKNLAEHGAFVTERISSSGLFKVENPEYAPFLERLSFAMLPQTTLMDYLIALGDRTLLARSVKALGFYPVCKDSDVDLLMRCVRPLWISVLCTVHAAGPPIATIPSSGKMEVAMEDVLTQLTRQFLPQMTAAEKSRALRSLKALIDAELFDLAASEGAEDDPDRACPWCGSPHYVKRGRDGRGRQRFLCRGCARTFTDATMRIFSTTKLDRSAWMRFAECHVDMLPLRESAEKCGVCLKTAFFMRHRLLEAMAKRMPAFRVEAGGGAELDECFFRESFKGNRSRSESGVPRKPRARSQGTDGHEKICVLTGINDAGDIFYEIAGRGGLDEAAARELLADKLAVGAIISTDRAHVYRRVLPALGVGEHIASKREEHAINRVNSLHSQMRHFIGRFRGVSTRRLENYLAWFKWTWCFKVRRSADELAELIVRQAARGTYEKTWRQYKVTPYPFYEYWIKQAKWDSRARRAIYGVA